MNIKRFLPSIAGDREVASLLAESIGNVTEGKLQELIQSSGSDDFPSIWIASCNDVIVGVLRVDSLTCARCTITHIATHPRYRRQRVGLTLVEFIRDELKFEQAEAETDDDAVSFYKACGFEVESLGMNEFGVQRYKCVRHF